MKRTRSLTVVFAALVPVLLLATANGCSGCKKETDDAKPATTASAPAPAPTPTAAPVVVEEDAGVPDAAPEAGPKPGGGGGGGIAKCCAALQQNANSAPLDQKAYYMSAAAFCNGAKNTSSAHQAFAQIRMFLAGAKMPGACQ